MDEGLREYVAFNTVGVAFNATFKVYNVDWIMKFHGFACSSHPGCDGDASFAGWNSGRDCGRPDLVTGRLGPQLQLGSTLPTAYVPVCISRECLQ